MNKRVLIKKINPILNEISFIFNEPMIINKKSFIGITLNGLVDNNKNIIGFLNIENKTLVLIVDYIFNEYIKQLYYGYELKYFLTNKKNQRTSLQKCYIEKYWSTDTNINNSYKIKLIPFNQNFETKTLLVKEFFDIYLFMLKK